LDASRAKHKLEPAPDKAMKLSTENLEQIRAYLAEKPVKKAYLFGSYGRGVAKMSSDVDILVELDYTLPIGLLFVQMKFDLESIIHKEVDLVSAKGLSKYIKPVIEREKLLIYAR
jgi:predicted nucleotidyltransferase